MIRMVGRIKMNRKYRKPEEFANPDAEIHVYTQKELTLLKDMAMHESIQSEDDQKALFSKFADGLGISKRANSDDAVRRRLWGMACRYVGSAEWQAVRSTKIKRGPWTWGEEDLFRKRIECKSGDVEEMDFNYYAKFFNRTVEDVIDKYQYLRNNGREPLLFH